ncbi:MAG: hypothetical protein ABII88_04920 [Candidatus Omnitrophota bacterium]
MKKLLNCKGLSFVEVVMATLILTAVLAGLFRIYSNANNMLKFAYHKAVSLTWAQGELERLRVHVVGGAAVLFDEQNNYAFGNQGVDRNDILANGAYISHTINGTNPPARINYYNNTTNILTIQKTGTIAQRVDCNQTASATGIKHFRQVSVRVNWTE